MEQLSELLMEHSKKYKMMQPDDAIKLLYQNEFGGGHIITDLAGSLSFLTREYESVKQTEALPFCEDIGNGLVRFYLNGIPKESLNTVNSIFVKSAECVKGNKQEFINKLRLLKRMTERGEMPFSSDEFSHALKEYESQGYPMISHSEIYRKEYLPSYRVVLKKYTDFLPLIFAIDSIIAEKGSVVLAVDGKCGSGKTTLANLLSTIFSCAIISMDDFFLPPELRTSERLSEVGGNVHYERFMKEVIPYLKKRQAFTYRAFDCGKMNYGTGVKIEPLPLIIVEGSYCLHPKFDGAYDITAFLSCDEEAQMKRLYLRNNDGELILRFKNEWIPMENKYELSFGIRNKCNFIFYT